MKVYKLHKTIVKDLTRFRQEVYILYRMEMNCLLMSSSLSSSLKGGETFINMIEIIKRGLDEINLVCYINAYKEVQT